VEKQTQSKLYQKYRKLFEYEKKEKEKLRKQVAHQNSENLKLKAHNGILSD